MNKPTIWAFALGVSLAVNVACIAALVTLGLLPNRGGDHRPPPATPAAAALFRAVDPRRDPEFGRAVQALRAERRAVREALMAEPFDAARLDAALARLRQAESRVASLAHRRVVAVAETLSAPERAALAEFVGRRPALPRELRRDPRRPPAEAPPPP